MRRLALIALIMITAVVLGAAPAPLKPAAPALPPDARAECERVLLIGDSTMEATGNHVARKLTAAGHCNTTWNLGKGSTGPAGTGGGYVWVHALPALLDAYRPTVLVAQFIGNTNILDWPTRVEAERTATLRMVDEAQRRGVRVYWSISFAQCINPYYGPWVASTLPILRRIAGMPDWRGIEQYGAGDCVHLSAAGSERAAGVVATAIAREWRREQRA